MPALAAAPPPAAALAIGEIRVSGASKIYHDRAGRGATLKEAALALFSSSRNEPTVRALQPINLRVAPGESLGIVGANGSGKSTLLKLIAGITEPTEGAVETRGRILGMIELGAGFHPELSGAENARLQGTIHGLRAREIERRMDAIFAYAELDGFRATPVKHYSTGMLARLGFALAAHCDPDILLVDEVLAVGDARFQERCLATFRQMRAAGKTLVFVTHEMELAERVCERIVWLKDGALRMSGPAREVTEAYMEESSASVALESEGALTSERIRIDAPGRFGSGEARMTEVRAVNAAGEARRRFAPGEPFGIEIEFECSPGVAAVDCAVTVTREDGHNAAHWRAEPMGALARPREGKGRFRLWFAEPRFGAGRYTYSPAISPPGGAGNHYDLLLRSLSFTIGAPSAARPCEPIELPASARWLNLDR